VIPGIPTSTPFETQTRREIGAIQWFPLKEISSGSNKFSYNVAPFIPPLLKWIKRKRREGSSSPPPPHHPSHHLTIEGDDDAEMLKRNERNEEAEEREERKKAGSKEQPRNVIDTKQSLEEQVNRALRPLEEFTLHHMQPQRLMAIYFEAVGKSR
jgi:hypothetical protein